MPPLAAALLALAIQSPSTVPYSRVQAASPDGKWFAWSLDDRSLHVCDLAKGRETYSLVNVASSSPRGPAFVERIAWSPDSARLALIGSDDDVWVFAAADGKVLARFGFGFPMPGDPDSIVSAHAAGLRFVEFLEGSSRLLIGGGDLRTSILDAASGKPLFVGRARNPAGLCALAPDRKQFALVQQDGTITLHRSTDGEQQGPSWRCKGTVHALAFDGSGSRLAVGGGGCKVQVFQIGKPDTPLELSLCDEDLTGKLEIGSVAFASDGRSLLATSFPWWVARAWDLEKATVLWSHDCGGGDDAPTLAAFTGDPSVVFVGAQGARLDRASGKVLSSLGKGQFRVQGNVCWTRERDSFRIFDARDGRLLADVPLTAR